MLSHNELIARHDGMTSRMRGGSKGPVYDVADQNIKALTASSPREINRESAQHCCGQNCIEAPRVTGLLLQRAAPGGSFGNLVGRSAGEHRHAQHPSPDQAERRQPIGSLARQRALGGLPSGVDMRHAMEYEAWPPS